MKAIIPKKELEECLSLGLTTTQIAKKYSCAECTVRRTCHRFGLNLPSKPIQKYARSHVFDTNFFSNIDTEQKAYILGFIAADGGLDRTWGCKISLHPKDLDILQKIATAMNCNYGPKYVENNTRISLGLYSVQLVKDLSKYGVVNNKTPQLPFAKNVPNEFVLDYMRGMFDGDGHFGSQRKNAGFVSGSKVFSEGFLSWYEDKYHTKPWSCIENGTKYRFRFTNKDIQFIKDMYDHATIYLDRKMELYNKWYRQK